MSSPLLILLPLCIASVHGSSRFQRQSTAEEIAATFLDPRFSAPAAPTLPTVQSPPGPIVETGKFDVEVVSSKLLRGADMPDIRRAPVNPTQNPDSSQQSAPHRELLQEPHHDQQQRLYRYDGPLDGRKVWIYKKILQPVRITANGMERLPGAQVVDQWAEGGFGNSLNSPMRTHIYAPAKQGLFTRTMGQFAHVQ